MYFLNNEIYFISRSGKVSSRNLILRRLDEDGFVVMTDRRSKKSKDLVWLMDIFV